MARTQSQMLDLGTIAPSFRLPEPARGKDVSLGDVVGSKGVLVMFICNHCPFVKHLAKELGEVSERLRKKGIGVVAISSNDAVAYPEDAPNKMILEARAQGWHFPYLFDESQDVAKSYRAVCTPDFFLFDSSLRLVYRGQFDASRPGNGTPVSGSDLLQAADALADGRSVSLDQKPSLGCSIKWRK